MLGMAGVQAASLARNPSGRRTAHSHHVQCPRPLHPPPVGLRAPPADFRQPPAPGARRRAHGLPALRLRAGHGVRIPGHRTAPRKGHRLRPQPDTVPRDHGRADSRTTPPAALTVRAELDRRDPDRTLVRATDADGFRRAVGGRGPPVGRGRTPGAGAPRGATEPGRGGDEISRPPPSARGPVGHRPDSPVNVTRGRVACSSSQPRVPHRPYTRRPARSLGSTSTGTARRCANAPTAAAPRAGMPAAGARERCCSVTDGGGWTAPTAFTACTVNR